MISWLFFAVSVWGALFTINALWPMRKPWPVIGLSFLPAWLTTELALHHIVWQAVATGVFVVLGALDEPIGWVGLAVTVTSWVGLASLLVTAHRTGEVVREALISALGAECCARLSEHRRDTGPIAWRRVLLPFLPTPRSVERIRGLPYADDDDPRHRLDVWRRHDLRPGAPVLLQIHGGGWMIGNKGQQGLPLMSHLARRGWVCVAINYRLSPRATWPDHLVDCKRALRWVREKIEGFGGDPDFVVVTGGSAGGHLTAMMALTANDPEYQPGFEDVDTRVDAWVPFYGVYDFTDRFGIRGESDPLRRALEQYVLKRDRDSDPDAFDRASPMSHVSGDIPPAMIIHGTRDSLAPVEEARAFVEMLRERSVEPVVYVEFAGAHHAFELFPSIRALHAINGVDAFVTWAHDRYARGDAGHDPSRSERSDTQGEYGAMTDPARPSTSAS